MVSFWGLLQLYSANSCSYSQNLRKNLQAFSQNFPLKLRLDPGKDKVIHKAFKPSIPKVKSCYEWGGGLEEALEFHKQRKKGGKTIK